jgi:hypothetical protein
LERNVCIIFLLDSPQLCKYTDLPTWYYFPRLMGLGDACLTGSRKAWVRSLAHIRTYIHTYIHKWTKTHDLLLLLDTPFPGFHQSLSPSPRTVFCCLYAEAGRGSSVGNWGALRLSFSTQPTIQTFSFCGSCWKCVFDTWGRLYTNSEFIPGTKLV